MEIPWVFFLGLKLLEKNYYKGTIFLTLLNAALPYMNIHTENVFVLFFSCSNVFIAGCQIAKIVSLCQAKL